MGMDFRGLVWKRVRKSTFFGLKSGKDLENRAVHPHQEFPGVPAPPWGTGFIHESTQTLKSVIYYQAVKKLLFLSKQYNCNLWSRLGNDYVRENVWELLKFGLSSGYSK